jgi:putative exosortase-associated protein (TIGR04073 family)
MGSKLVRGAVNTVTGIVEWPMQTVKGYRNGVTFIKNRPASTAVGTVLGFLRGITHAAGRTGHGLIDVFACWAANAPDNQGVGVPLDAEYAWEEGTQYSIFKPNLKEGLMPYPRKLVRGLANGLLGIAEVPGQIVKGAGASEPGANIASGAVKGVWYWLSRTAHGIPEAILFLVPNPPDQVGNPLDEKWPWDALLK